MTEIKELNNIYFNYPLVNLSLPHFMNDGELAHFLTSPGVMTEIIPHTKSHLIGKLVVSKRAVFKEQHLCGVKDRMKENANYIGKFTQRLEQSKSKNFSYVAPIISPSGSGINDFLEFVIPSIMQGLDILTKEEVEILLVKHAEDTDLIISIIKFLKLHIPYDPTGHIIWLQPKEAYVTNYLILSCDVPSFHPQIISKFRKTLGIPETLVTPRNISYVLLLGNNYWFIFGLIKIAIIGLINKSLFKI